MTNLPAADEPTPDGSATGAEPTGEPTVEALAAPQPDPAPGAFPPPPPGTGGWATRFGLVRPVQGRVFAGVCASLGRATNTDPVLWRVLLAVFTLFGGTGLLAYVIGWLLIPGEGDSGSPAESLIGRGRSSTSPIVVIVIGVVAATALGTAMLHGFASGIVPIVAIMAAIVLVMRRNGGQATGRQPGEVSTGPIFGPLASAAMPPPSYPGAATMPGRPQYQTVPMPGPGAPPAATQPQPGYRPAFAPHGPYAGHRYPYPGLTGVAGLPPAVPPPPGRPARTRPPRPRSRLGLITVSLCLLAVGVLVSADLAMGDVPVGGYLALVLSVIGLGLLVGTWFGRARSLIFPGLLVAVVLATSTQVGHLGKLESGRGDITWAPTTISDVHRSYVHGLGTATLDLTGVDFSDRTVTISVHVNAGDLHVMLPAKVDTTVLATVNAGNAKVFDNSWDGLNKPPHKIVNLDSDGPGGGSLTLNLLLNTGTLEVSR